MFADFTDLFHEILQHPGQAYPQVVAVALIATGVVIVLHFLAALIFRRKGRIGRVRWSLWERLVYTITVLSIAVLAVTAFYSVLRLGVMEGWFLFAHMMGSGALVPMLLLLAVTWADANRFGRRPGQEQDGDAADKTGQRRSRFSGFAKFTFWIILVSGLVTASTMLASMLPIMDTDALHRLLDIHRYSGLLLVVATSLHLYRVWLRRLGWG